MHVISRKRLNEFAQAYPDSKASLAPLVWTDEKEQLLYLRGVANDLRFS